MNYILKIFNQIKSLFGYLKKSFCIKTKNILRDFEVLYPYEVSCGTKYVFVHLCLRVGSFNFNLITLNFLQGYKWLVHSQWVLRKYLLKKLDQRPFFKLHYMQLIGKYITTKRTTSVKYFTSFLAPIRSFFLFSIITQPKKIKFCETPFSTKCHLILSNQYLIGLLTRHFDDGLLRCQQNVDNQERHSLSVRFFVSPPGLINRFHIYLHMSITVKIAFIQID